NKIKIIIESNLFNLPLLRKTIRGVCSTVVKDEKIFEDIELSLNEALTNVIYYAYQNEPDHEIQITVNLNDNEVVFQIIDEGVLNTKSSFDPLKVNAKKNLDNFNIEEIAESGRGLFLIHQLMDEVHFSTVNNKNCLVLKKRFK
ncbi:MAG: ATP-binding protein, partial [Parachlamydiaceae bacterium]|nr:ATP-binding protein [Parachlamydiaceae bacterium]